MCPIKPNRRPDAVGNGEACFAEAYGIGSAVWLVQRPMAFFFFYTCGGANALYKLLALFVGSGSSEDLTIRPAFWIIRDRLLALCPFWARVQRMFGPSPTPLAYMQIFEGCAARVPWDPAGPIWAIWVLRVHRAPEDQGPILCHNDRLLLCAGLFGPTCWVLDQKPLGHAYLAPGSLAKWANTKARVGPGLEPCL